MPILGDEGGIFIDRLGDHLIMRGDEHGRPMTDLAQIPGEIVAQLSHAHTPFPADRRVGCQCRRGTPGFVIGAGRI